MLASASAENIHRTSSIEHENAQKGKRMGGGKVGRENIIYFILAAGSDARCEGGFSRVFFPAVSHKGRSAHVLKFEVLVGRINNNGTHRFTTGKRKHFTCVSIEPFTDARANKVISVDKN